MVAEVGAFNVSGAGTSHASQWDVREWRGKKKFKALGRSPELLPDIPGPKR